VTIWAVITQEILDTGESEAHMLLNTILSLPLESFNTTDQLLKAKCKVWQNIFSWQLSPSFPTPNSLLYVIDPEVTALRFQYILMTPICTVWNTTLFWLKRQIISTLQKALGFRHAVWHYSRILMRTMCCYT